MLDVERIRKQLEARLEELGERVHDIEDDLRAPADPDFAEQATEAEGDEVLEGLERSSIQEIEHIRSALQRIEDGTYGECARCGEEIAEKRLEAVPYATTCIKCASGG